MAGETKEKKEKKAKKQRQSKREIVVLEVMNDPADRFGIRQGGFKDAAAARKWIRESGDSLAGKTVRIGSLSESMTIKVETVSKVRFE